MHHIYHTEGIILGSKNFGEAGRYYSILTRDLGMIYASAQGVRKMSSKLRFVLHDFAHIKVDLVQGKEFWRVTSASKTDTLKQVTKRRETFVIFANLARLLKRLLTGAEPNERLFSLLVEGLTVLEKTDSTEALRNVEAIIVLRIMNSLGYIGGESVDNFVTSPYEDDFVFEISKHRSRLLSLINKALGETHL